MRRYATLLILVLLPLFIGSAAGFSYNYIRSFQNVSIHIDQGATANIYRGAIEDEGPSYDKNAPLYTITKDTVLRLKKDSYLAIVDDPSRQYESDVINFDVTSYPLNVAIAVTLNKDTLAKLLTSEQQAINDAISQALPSALDQYSLSKPQLYLHGEWFGAAFVPKDPNHDILKLVVRKKNGVWELALNPPTITASKSMNPDIPPEVLDDVINNK